MNQPTLVQRRLAPLTPGSIAVFTGGLALAALSAPIAAWSPILLGAGLAAFAMAFAICLHPPLAAYILLGTTPLIVGMDRGLVVPLLRPSEAVLIVVAVAVMLRVGVDLARGASERHLSLGRLDASLIFLATTGSIVPVLWLVARGKSVALDDLLYGLQLWKYYAIFLIVRATIRTDREVSKCLLAAMLAASVVSLVAILQSLQLFGVPGLLMEYYGQEEDFASDERGTSTIASSLAVGDVMVVSLAIAATALLRQQGNRVLLTGLAITFVLGVIAAGQFSGYIAFFVAVAVVGMLTGSLGRYIAALVPVVAVGAVALRPVIAKRLAGFEEETGLPHSWVGRWENLKTFFWPELGNFNWVLGVRPAARVPAPEAWREWVFIESGHTWLLWTGGVPFFIAFWVFIWVAGRRVLAAARRRVDAIGTAAVATFTSLVVIVVLMTFDPHLTLRGMGELTFALLALALTGSSDPPGRPRGRSHSA